MLLVQLPPLDAGWHTIGILLFRPSPKVSHRLSTPLPKEALLEAQQDEQDEAGVRGEMLALRKVTIEVALPTPTAIQDLTAIHWLCSKREYAAHGEGSGGEGDEITLTSIGSIDRALQLMHVAALWHGPVSFSLYARTDREREGLEELVTHVLLPLSRGRRQSITVSPSKVPGLPPKVVAPDFSQPPFPPRRKVPT